VSFIMRVGDCVNALTRASRPSTRLNDMIPIELQRLAGTSACSSGSTSRFDAPFVRQRGPRWLVDRSTQSYRCSTLHPMAVAAVVQYSRPANRPTNGLKC
jgi:hypothetical protein